MNSLTLSQSIKNPHDHVFLSTDQHSKERKVWLVIALTLITMFAEIIAGLVYGSMALLADGLHMFTHAGAMLITALAYYLARRNATNPRFTFGTGKISDLAGFSSALLLALVALMVGFESLMRLAHVKEIAFDKSILVAVIGLVVNLFCAYLLHEKHDHNHQHHDNNLRSAYLHVITDALTSVLAIIALILGLKFGLLWADPVIGILGAVIIAKWSLKLMSDTSNVLLDATYESVEICKNIKQVFTPEKITITDLHVWKINQNHFAVIIVLSHAPKTVEFYKKLLTKTNNLAHVTIEINNLPGNQAPWVLK